MKPRIAIIIPTFLRDSLLCKCLNSIKKYWSDDYYVIIVDQGKCSKEKEDFINDFLLDYKGDYIQTEFDIGALSARNHAIKRCHELNIPYILMFADSMTLLDNYDFTIPIEFLEQDPMNFLCGFNKTNSICTWECDMKKTDRFALDIPRRSKIEYKGLQFQPVDICRNIFLCKTELLIDSLYDENRKMGDHEGSFFRFQQKGYKCFYNDSLLFGYERNREGVYGDYREKNFREGRQILKNSYNLKKWVSYSDDLKAKWQNEK